jgi:hypothetical protein
MDLTREALLQEILELLHNDSDFPAFEMPVTDSDGSAIISLPGKKEFMLIVVDVTE